MTTDRLSGAKLRHMILVAAKDLEANRAAVDALNVFPVPDGDTGTNMNLTMQAALRELAKCTDETAHEVGRAISLGSLMGARGNSGVILSQLFRGIGRGLEGRDDLTATDLAQALQSGVDTAYKAVMRPVEGTILTVAREMARAAARAAKANATIDGVLAAALEAAEITLARTPDLLPVLKQAGVVDAGGKGLVVILAGMVRGLAGETAIVDAGAEAAEPAVAAPAADPAAHPAGTHFRIDEELGDITFAYDTQVLVRGSAIAIDAMRDELGQYGDSLLVVGTPEIVKVHVHTNNPGLVLEACLRYGTLTDITIDNMRDQFEAIKHTRAAGNGETQAERPASAAVQLFPPVVIGVDMPEKQVGVVTVAAGDGVEQIFRSLGADVIVSGGQTMNPSIEELIVGIESVGLQDVLLVPNNSNILMAARQAVDLTDKRVVVVPTRNVPQGVSALLAYNPQADAATNQQRMDAAMSRIKTGEITYAVRSTKFNDWEIAEGDILGVVDDDIVATGDDPNTVLAALLAKLVDEDSEFVTLLYGSDIAAGVADAAVAMVHAQHPAVEVECHRGGQPLFYYLVSVE